MAGHLSAGELRAWAYATPAGPDDAAAIGKLLRETPLPGSIRLTFEREGDPSLAAGIEGDRHLTALVRDGRSGAVIGMGSRSVRSVWVDGNVRRTGYLGLLRRHPAAPRAVLGMAGAFRILDADRRPDEAGWDFTSIMDGNRRAATLLERGHAGLPRYERLGSLTTFILTSDGRGFPGGAVRSAVPGDLPRIVDCLDRNYRRFQLAPTWDLSALLDPARCRGLGLSDFFVHDDGERITGALALWDQRPFRQTVVRGYARLPDRLRPVINVLLRLGGKPGLPPAGSRLDLAFLSHVAIDRDDPRALVHLVRVARIEAAKRGIAYVVTGFDSRSPLARAVSRAFSPRRYGSTLYTVHHPGRSFEPPPSSGALLHPEVAIL